MALSESCSDVDRIMQLVMSSEYDQALTQAMDNIHLKGMLNKANTC